MRTLDHTCSSCQSEFVVSYSENTADDDPTYCPFCGEYLALKPINNDDAPYNPNVTY